jgi:hypothetical protein
MANRQAIPSAAVRSEDAGPRVGFAEFATWSQIDSAVRGTAPQGQAVRALWMAPPNLQLAAELSWLQARASVPMTRPHSQPG